MVHKGGYIAGAQDVVFPEDRGTHQDDLATRETAGWSEIHRNWDGTSLNVIMQACIFKTFQLKHKKIGLSGSASDIVSFLMFDKH